MCCLELLGFFIFYFFIMHQNSPCTFLRSKNGEGDLTLRIYSQYLELCYVHIRILVNLKLLLYYFRLSLAHNKHLIAVAWVSKAIMRNTEEEYLTCRYQDKIQEHEIVKYVSRIVCLFLGQEWNKFWKRVVLDSGVELLVIMGIKGRIFFSVQRPLYI